MEHHIAFLQRRDKRSSSDLRNTTMTLTQFYILELDERPCVRKFKMRSAISVRNLESWRFLLDQFLSTFVTMSSNANDPRDAALETRVTFPKTWKQEDTGVYTVIWRELVLTYLTDTLGSSNMFLSGLIMVTRNRMLSWPALFVGFTSFINQHPLRAKEGKQGYNGIL